MSLEKEIKKAESILDQIKRQKLVNTAIEGLKPQLESIKKEIISDRSDKKLIELADQITKTLITTLEGLSTKIEGTAIKNEDRLISIIEKTSNLKKGEPGRSAKTPIKGKDYFTDKDKEDFIKLIVDSIELPQKGKDYFTDIEVQQIIAIIESNLKQTILDATLTSSEIEQYIYKILKKENLLDLPIQKLLKFFDNVTNDGKLRDQGFKDPIIIPPAIIPNEGGGGGGDMLESTYDPQGISADAFARANHTGTQTISTITDLPEAIEFFNGTFVEPFNALVTSDGTNVNLTIEKKGGGDLTMSFSDGNTILDCTPIANVALTAGTNVIPQENYIYIPRSTKVLTVSTTGFPNNSVEHIKVAFAFLPSAAKIQTEGAFVNQNWNDERSEVSGQGHLSHITEKMRYALGATYRSGIDLTTTVVTNAGALDDAYVSTTSGIIIQLHSQAISAKDMQTGDDAHVINSNVSAYREITNLNQITTDANGGSLTNRYFNLTLALAANKSGGYAPYLINVPTGSYNSLTDAIADPMGYNVDSLPDAFAKDSSTGLLLYRITMRKTAVNGGTLTFENTVDLRTNSRVGGAPSITPQQEFSDNNFRILDNLDPTKEIAFQASGITTGTTRTLTVPDSNGTILLDSNTGTASGDIPVLGAGGKLANSVLPDIAISEYFGNFTDLATALLDVGVQGSQRGDWFTVDTDGGHTYIVISDNPTIAGDVRILNTPTDSVASVNGLTGIVTLTTDDISEGASNLYYTETRVSNNTDVSANTTARHDAITLAGTPDYLTLTGQQITLNQIDLTTDVSGVLPIANGGTNASSQITNGVNYFNGTSITSNSNLTYNGSSLAIAGDVTPQADNTRNLGTSSLRWNNLHSSTLNTTIVNIGISGEIRFRDGSGTLRSQWAYDFFAPNDIVFNTYNSGGSFLGRALSIGTSSVSIGFYGQSATTKQTVTGAKGGNAALTSLLSALSTIGLITDSTT